MFNVKKENVILEKECGIYFFRVPFSSFLDAMSGYAILFSAPSGAGKTSLVKALIKQNSDLCFSISATSRPPRGQETHGKDYYFMDAEVFQGRVRHGDFLEWEEVYPGRFYGTLREEVERIWRLGKNIAFDIDVRGGQTLKEKLGNRALSVFVKPPSLEALAARLANRQTDTSEDIKSRLDKAAYELSFEMYFDKVVVNDKFEDTLAETQRLYDELRQR